ncbi:MAG TPA: tetratricopeptide repeat protein [Streptosporangiaceae bacterium]|nr:tetratricopeptide repeat protein [Streptosporangiaceae bacterium]
MTVTQGTQLADRWGVAVHGATEEGIARLNDAVECLLALSGDPVARAEEAAAAAPDMALARICRAYLSLYGTTADGVAEAARIVGESGPPPADGREAAHLQAARAWSAGDWTAATRALERALVLNPRDALALKVAQDLYFFLGSRLDLRDVAARVLPAWPQGQPGWGYVQGIYAFGLEENGDYRQAQNRAEAALAANPRDVWSVHAVAHVYEMEGSQQAGIHFMSATLPNWRDSYFAVHNWWHRALYSLELGEIDEVLALYDGQVRARPSLEWLDIVDAAALLWRLALYGADVRERATRLADDIAPLLDSPPVYIFNDWHAAMALGLAGRHERSQQVIADNRRLAAGTNRKVAELAGLTLLEGFSAFAAGRPEDTLETLIDIRQIANVAGGSHAQRDIIDLTLLAAAARAGQSRLARALAREREARKPAAAPATERLIAANSR